ncbi:MAG: hypothetical protein RXN92_01615 [Thermoplasmatales archaeon]
MSHWNLIAQFLRFHVNLGLHARLRESFLKMFSAPSYNQETLSEMGKVYVSFK